MTSPKDFNLQDHSTVLMCVIKDDLMTMMVVADKDRPVDEFLNAISRLLGTAVLVLMQHGHTDVTDALLKINEKAADHVKECAAASIKSTRH